MYRFFQQLESIMNSTTINEFKEYISNFKNVKKWIIVSDYCIGDRNKNDTITFTLFPYVLSFEQLQGNIKDIAQCDIKHTNFINEELCNFYKSGLVYSFSFILEKDNFLNKFIDKTSIEKTVKYFIDLMKQWEKNTPINAQHYRNIIKKLNKISQELRRSTFNTNLFRNIITISFLVNYITILLCREVEIEVIGWFSDIDKITTTYDSVVYDWNEIQNHCLCNELFGEQYKQFTLCYGKSVNDAIFYEELNRIADYICGFVADFNAENTSVSMEKYATIGRKIISDNKYISTFRIKNDKIEKIIFKSEM